MITGQPELHTRPRTRPLPDGSQDQNLANSKAMEAGGSEIHLKTENKLTRKLRYNKMSDFLNKLGILREARQTIFFCG